MCMQSIHAHVMLMATLGAKAPEDGGTKAHVTLVVLLVAAGC